MSACKGIVTGLCKSEVMHVPNLKGFQEGFFRISEGGSVESAEWTGLRPLDLGLESHRGHGYLSVVSVVCCQVEVSATS